MSANGPAKDAWLWGATIGAVVGYTAAVLAPFVPSLYYYPKLDAWRLAPVADENAVRWYGYMLYALAGGALGAIAGRITGRRAPWRLILGFATLCLLALAWHERRWFEG